MIIHNPFIDRIIHTEDVLSSLEIDELLRQTNLKESFKYGMTALMMAMNCNKKRALNLTPQQWDYLIEKSDLTCENFLGHTALTLYIENAIEEKINLSKSQQDKLLNAQCLKQGRAEDFLIAVFRSQQALETIGLTFGWVVVDKIIDDYCGKNAKKLSQILKKFDKIKNTQCSENYQIYVLRKSIETERSTLEATLSFDQKECFQKKSKI